MEKNSNSDLETLCKKMDTNKLLTYIISQLPHPNKLHEQLPNALKLAPNASNLVLSCTDHFFTSKEASLLLLECFLIMGIDEIDEMVKQEAELAALKWRKRLIDEGGGIMKANESDSRGLLLLIGCFGIPREFRNEDVRDLLRVSSIREISSALRRSNVLMAKIPEIIEGMVKHKMEIDAVDVAYTFGVEEKFSPCAILSSFLQEFKESLKKRKWKSHGKHAVVDEANMKELSTLKSVIECLEGHNIDPSKLIPRFRISDRIMSLEKKIGRNKQRRERMVQNGNVEEPWLCKRFKVREAKPSRIVGPDHRRAVNHVDSQRTLLEGGTAGNIYGYSGSPSVLPRPVAGLVPETVSCSLAGSDGGAVMGGVGSGVTTGTDSTLQVGSYAGFRRGMLVDSKARRSYNDQLYGWQGDASTYGRPVPHNYGYGPSTPWQGSIGLPNTDPVGVGHQTSATDVYQFANAVPGSASFQNSGSNAVGTVPSVNHHSSYLYPGTYNPQGMH